MSVPAPSMPPIDPDPRRGFMARVLGALRLDPEVFEDIENDPSALVPALGVVVLSSAAAGLALRAGLNGLVVGVLASIFTWYVWALVTWWVGTRLLPEPATSATQGELVRTLGFATAPGVFRLVGVVPALQGLAFAVAAVWMLAAAVIAVRQALDYRSTWRAIAVVGIGWLIQWAVLVLVLMLTRAAV
jgi:hypothetical protein